MLKNLRISSAIVISAAVFSAAAFAEDVAVPPPTLMTPPEATAPVAAPTPVQPQPAAANPASPPPLKFQPFNPATKPPAAPVNQNPAAVQVTQPPAAQVVPVAPVAANPVSPPPLKFQPFNPQSGTVPAAVNSAPPVASVPNQAIPAAIPAQPNVPQVSVPEVQAPSIPGGTPTPQPAPSVVPPTPQANMPAPAPNQGIPAPTPNPGVMQPAPNTAIAPAAPVPGAGPAVTESINSPANPTAKPEADPALEALKGRKEERARSGKRDKKNKGKDAKEILTDPPEMKKTILFRQEYYDKYQMVLKAYKERLKNAALAPKPVPANVPKKDTMTKIMSKLKAPEAELKKLPDAIYVNTLLYTSPTVSSAWINGKKISVGDTLDGVKFVSASPEGVRLEIQTMDYAIDPIAWSETFSESKRASLPPNRRSIMFNPQSNLITVMLRPNQRLDTVNMVVREGKVDRGDMKNMNKKEQVRADDLLNKVGDLNQPAPSPSPADMPPVAEPPATPPADPGAEVKAEFPIGPDGHFTVPAQLNGHSIDFKADTGATVTAISVNDAKKIGLDVMNLDYSFDVRLADGSIIKAAQTNIENIKIGNINIQNVNILITQGGMAKPLMGMTLLSRLKRYSVENNVLTMVQ